jgi:RimJ/RimL family protein N-acetyltransferase
MALRRKTLRRRIAGLRFPLRGRRVDLVPPAPAHLPEIVRLLEEPSVARWTLHIPHPYRMRDGREYLRRATRERRLGRSLALTVVRRGDGAVLGGVGLHRLEEWSPSGEAGWWIGREHRGHGYATEAVDLLLRTGFNRLGLHRVEARVFPQNSASRAVARRCGFRYEGRLRDEARKGRRWQATLLFARLASDPPVRQTARRR